MVPPLRTGIEESAVTGMACSLGRTGSAPQLADTIGRIVAGRAAEHPEPPLELLEPPPSPPDDEDEVASPLELLAPPTGSPLLELERDSALCPLELLEPLAAPELELAGASAPPVSYS